MSQENVEVISRIYRASGPWLLFELLDEGVERGVEIRVVGVLSRSATGLRSGCLTGRDQGLGQVVIDVGIDAGQRQLNSGESGVVPSLEHHPPAR